MPRFAMRLSRAWTSLRCWRSPNCLRGTSPRFVVRAMNANPHPRRVPKAHSQRSQEMLRFEHPAHTNRIPDEKKVECIALLRELLEAVSHHQVKAGGSHD